MWLEYQELSRQVWSDNEVQSALKEGYELLKKAEKVGNKELYEKFRKEYSELEASTKQAISDNRSISKQERAKIMLELSDIVELAEKNWISDEKAWYSKLWDKWKKTDTKDAKEKANALRNKNVNEYTSDEAISAIEYLSKNYKNYKVAESSDKIAIFYDTINELDDQYEVRKFQEKLSEKIFWNSNQFNSEYIQWFNNEKWNHIVKIKSFEQTLFWNNIKEINSLALANYIKYLSSRWEATPEKLLNKFGQWNLEQLAQLWEWNKDTVVQKELNKLWLWSIIETISLFSSTEKFLSGVSRFDKNGKSWELAIIYLNKNREVITRKFASYIKNTIDKDFPDKSTKEKEEILKNIIWEFEGVKSSTDLTKIAEKIVQVKEKYKLNSLSWKEATGQIIERWKVENRAQKINTEIKIWEAQKAYDLAQKNWDIDWMNIHSAMIHWLTWELKETKKNEVKYAANTAILKRIDDTTITQIWTGEKKLEDIVQELRKHDKSFDEELKKYEALEKNLEKWVINSNKLPESKAQNETITYPNGTTLEYSQTNNGYALKTETWDIQITPEEFKIIKGNEQAKENLVNFKNTLDELNITWLWNYRSAIFKGLWNMYVSDFNEKDNYLSKNELKIFLVSILQSIWADVSFTENINTIKTRIKAENFVWALWGTKDVNILWNSTIENTFIQKFDSKRTGTLEQSKFEKSLNGLFWVKS